MAEVLAKPVKLAQLSQDLTTISGEVRKGLSSTRESGLIDSSAYGNSTGVEAVANAYNSVFEKGGTAVEDLTEVLEGDIDRVLRMAFSYQETDEKNAEKIPECRPGKPC
ncbi:hypothetical protein [Stackebrandtia nassauensis]|uniref:PE domain-containing protein n=1 Tax=Stackebrandtia nassauensis (strain DSM 44728 / CIP 108903 / NRRL B-16338 / NBRC 102104 / LLR-40K-21) TaxID=446470 RepID=D3Q8G4_STANL|nr:hypothetical protein [Stackebrandtia nassauensis]ADD42538.1 hypothetical protein Snas_2863 [Stackebrandtia nassauensis DSM 44728]